MGEGFNIIQFLKNAVATGASDEHLLIGFPPVVRINGIIKKTNLPQITNEEIEKAVIEIAPDLLKKDILSKCDWDFIYEIENCSRFRVNYHRTIGNISLSIRNIPYLIPSLEDLSLPTLLNEIVNYKNGIVFVTGPTGSGKSTTLAAIISKIAQTHAKHIITIEEPIEYIFQNKKSIFSQRQVGVDTESFTDGLKYALRQDPDIILIGEVRDKETLEAALHAAETGHLVFATLHTNDAVQTINRVINFFEEQSRGYIRRQLAETLRTTIAQQLIISTDGKKRYPACEIMTVTPAIRDYMLRDNVDGIYELINENNIDNMISMNMSLFRLVKQGLINKEDALSNSNDSNELDKMLQGIYQGTRKYYDDI